MKSNKTQSKLSNKEENISRKDAMKKIGSYGKYAAFTALGTYLLLHPKTAQASSPVEPGDGGGF